MRTITIMFKSKSTILLTSIVILLIPHNSYSCGTFPKTIKIKNSPFYFKSFTLNGATLTVPSPDGSKLVLSCDKKGAKKSPQWKAGAEDKNGSSLGSHSYGNIHKDAMIYEQTEIPIKTVVVLQTGKGSFSRGEIIAKGSQRYLKMKCEEHPNTGKKKLPGGPSHTFTVYIMKRGKKNPIHKISAFKSGMRYRSPTRQYSGEVDFDSDSPKSLNFTDCGGLSSPSDSYNPGSYQ